MRGGNRADPRTEPSPYLMSISDVEFEIWLYEMDIKYGDGSVLGSARIYPLLLSCMQGIERPPSGLFGRSFAHYASSASAVGDVRVGRIWNLIC